MANYNKTEGFNPIIDADPNRPKNPVKQLRYRNFTTEEIDKIVEHMYTKTIDQLWHMIRPVGISQRTFKNRIYWMRKHPTKNFYKKICSK